MPTRDKNHVSSGIDSGDVYFWRKGRQGVTCRSGIVPMQEMPLPSPTFIPLYGVVTRIRTKDDTETAILRNRFHADKLEVSCHLSRASIKTGTREQRCDLQRGHPYQNAQHGDGDEQFEQSEAQ